jgi:hypothetical protein
MMVGIGEREDDRLWRHHLDHVLGHRALGREAEKHVGIDQRLRQGARRGLHRIGGFPLVHAVLAAFVDDALGVAQNHVLGPEADGAQQLEAGDAGGAGAVANQPGAGDIAAGEVERIYQAGGADDRGAVLVIVEHRDVEQLAQLLLDDEAFRRIDVFEIDGAPTLSEEFHAIDELVRILGRDFEIDGIDVGKALEQHRLAFHHRLGRERAAIAQPKNGGAVGDHGDEIALGGVVVGFGLVLGDGQDRNGDAGRIGQRQVALRRHRLGGDNFKLAGPALAVKQQGFLVGKSRPLRAAAVFGSHFNSLPLTPGRKVAGIWNCSEPGGSCSRERRRRGRFRPNRRIARKAAHPAH